MQLTRAADYAVRVMIHMATLPAGACAQRSVLAGATGVSDSFLSKVLQRLVQCGMLASTRGTGGGFRLAILPESVSLLDVVEAIEGPTALNACLDPGIGCERQGRCAAHRVWVDAQSALTQVLGKATIQELAQASVVNPPFSQVRAADSLLDARREHS